MKVAKLQELLDVIEKQRLLWRRSTNQKMIIVKVKEVRCFHIELTEWEATVQSFKMLTEKIGHCTFKSTAFAFKHGLTGLSSLRDRAISSLAFKDWHFRIISLGQMLPAIMLPNSIIPQIDMICKYLRASLNCMTLLCCWFTSRINALCATILLQYFYIATELLRSKWSTT